MTFDYVSISAQDFFFHIRNIRGNVQKVRHGKWCPCLLLLKSWPLWHVFSRESHRDTQFFFVSFSKDVFLVLVKSETNRVTGKPNMGRTRVENRKEGKPWRANWREFIWQLVAVPRTQPDLSRAASYSRFSLPLWQLAMARLPRWSRFEVARGLESFCLSFSSRGGRCTSHCVRIENTHSYWTCVCPCGDGVARSSVVVCVDGEKNQNRSRSPTK